MANQNKGTYSQETKRSESSGGLQSKAHANPDSTIQS